MMPDDRFVWWPLLVCTAVAVAGLAFAAWQMGCSSPLYAGAQDPDVSLEPEPLDPIEPVAEQDAGQIHAP